MYLTNTGHESAGLRGAGSGNISGRRTNGGEEGNEEGRQSCHMTSWHTMFTNIASQSQ